MNDSGPEGKERRQPIREFVWLSGLNTLVMVASGAIYYAALGQWFIWLVVVAIIAFIESVLFVRMRHPEGVSKATARRMVLIFSAIVVPLILVLAVFGVRDT